MEDVQVKFRENESKYLTREDVLVQIFDEDSEFPSETVCCQKATLPLDRNDGEKVEVDGAQRGSEWKPVCQQ